MKSIIYKEPSVALLLDYENILDLALIDVILELKNAVDYQCMFDCRDAAKNQPDLETFIFVTGDGDYACGICLLKNWDKKVIVLSRRGSASKILKKLPLNFTTLMNYQKFF